ncbi:plasmid mobilization protein [Maritalea sp.]|uniref:plasmid mobilization protein n=1 Tax=Maritalea sp. TaxID=2003361 RepID=UPI003EF255F3
MRKVEDFPVVAPIGVDFTNSAEQPPEPKKKQPRITFRVTDEKMAKLAHLSAGMSLSAYMRHCLFGKDNSPRKMRSRVPIKDQQALGRVLFTLGPTRIDNNLNQIAYEANCGSLLLDVQTDERLNEACQHIMDMRSDLVKALGVGDGAAP